METTGSRRELETGSFRGGLETRWFRGETETIGSRGEREISDYLLYMLKSYNNVNNYRFYEREHKACTSITLKHFYNYMKFNLLRTFFFQFYCKKVSSLIHLNYL